MAPYFGFRGRRLHTAIWIQSWVAVTIFGYSSAGAGGVLNMPSFEAQFPSLNVNNAAPDQVHHKSTIQGTVVALYTLFGVFGALACTFLGDSLGRRKAIFVAALANLIGAILMASSYSLTQFIFGRIFLGLGTGGIVATVPVWQSELSKASSRGSHVTSVGIACGTGLSLALWVGFGMSFVTGQASWRVTLAGSGVLSIMVMVFIFTLPESPRWLMKKDRFEEARNILELLHPGERNAVDSEVDDIKLSLNLSTHSASLKDMFTMGPQRIFHRVMLASIVQIMLQFTGVNAIAFYTPTIYENSLHFPAVEAGALSAASQACIILGGLICSFTVDRYGRRALLLASAIGMSICLACVTGLVASDKPSASKAAVFFLYLYYVIYTLGYIGIPFLYASEIAPVQLRAAICGVSTAVSWLFNFLVVEITPVGFADIGYQYFIIYTVTCASFVPIVYFFFPETAGRSLEEIDGIFAESRSIFDTVSVARKLPKMRLTELAHGEKVLSEFVQGDHTAFVEQARYEAA